ncbi:MAG: TRAP transporter small permease [Hyphomicrobiales bacterium]|nr:TRAP transporter small permease [Hyphomicrobiales bacterium]MCP5371567.1 TRAP transporter small permease [Hyphomicrobiales bacterium]
MGLICVISISNVVVRYATNVSFAFTEEYSVFLLVVLTFVGSALAISTGGHLRIGFFVERLGPRGQALCDFLAMAATTAMFAVLVYYGADVTIDEYIYEETSPGLGYPTWIYTMWLPMLSLAVIFRVLEPVIRGGGKGR